MDFFRPSPPITTAPFPTTLLPTTSGAASDVVAIMSFSQTTVTAHEVPGTTGLAVVDGTTLTWRSEGITLSNGAVISLGFNGLIDSTTTALYETLASVPSSGGPTSSMTTNATTTITSSGLATTSISLGGPLSTATLSSGQVLSTSTSVSSVSPASAISSSGQVSSGGTVTVTSMPSSDGSASAKSAGASGQSQSASGSASSSASSSGGQRLSMGRAAMVLGILTLVVVASG